LRLVAGSYYSMTTLLGNGTGGFTSAGTIPVDPICRSAVLRDLDHDGKLDVATLIVPPTGPLSRGTILTLRGDGSGGFTLLTPTNTVSDVPVGSDARSVAIGDVNSDSIPDLCTASYQSNDVSVALGIGNGSYLPA